MAPPARVTKFALKSENRNLRIVLKHEKKENVLKEPFLEVPTDNATAAAKNAYQKLKDESTESQLPHAGFNGARAATTVRRH